MNTNKKQEQLLKLNTIQQEAVFACINHYKNNTSATVVLHTGLGKTFVFFKLLYELFPDYKETKYRILTLAEVNIRQDSFKENALEFKKLYDLNPYVDFDIVFRSHRGAVKKKEHFDFILIDEIHDAITPEYSRVLFDDRISWTYLLGITATIGSNITYSAKKLNSLYEKHNKYNLHKKHFDLLVDVNKKDILQYYAPIIYNYNINDALENSLSRKITIYKIYNHLNNEDKNIKSKKYGRVISVNELEQYEILTDKLEYFKQQMKQYLITNAALARANFLYNLTSKINLSKKLILHLMKKKKKTLVFANTIPTIKKISPVYVASDNTLMNDSSIEAFNKGKVNLLGSVNMLIQGINLNQVDCILLNSFKASKDKFIQIIGRARLNQKDEDIDVYIIVTKDTVEERWFNSMTEDLDCTIIDVPNLHNFLLTQ